MADLQELIEKLSGTKAGQTAQALILGGDTSQLGWPEDVSGAMSAAAARTRQSVMPAAGRQQGFMSAIVPGMASGLLSLPERAMHAAGDLQRTGDVYDPAPAVGAALMTMGGAPVGAPRGALGAGPIRPIMSKTDEALKAIEDALGAPVTKSPQASQGKTDAALRSIEDAMREPTQVGPAPSARPAPTLQQNIDALVTNMGNPQGLRAYATKNGLTDAQVSKLINDTYDHKATAQKTIDAYLATGSTRSGPETISAAATRYDGKVYQGAHHGEAVELAAKDTGKTIDEIADATLAADDGFVTSTGRFVSRQEAMGIAKGAGQLGLFSRIMQPVKRLTLGEYGAGNPLMSEELKKP